MIRPLRKRHLQIWTLMALLLPAGVIAAYLLVPHKATSEIISAAQQPPFQKIIGSADFPSYKINLREDENGNQQLEWIIKVPLTSPSAFIYHQTKSAWTKMEQNQLIGVLGSKGIYRYALTPDDSSGNIAVNTSKIFLLYDAIHDKVIDKVVLRNKS